MSNKNIKICSIAFCLVLIISTALSCQYNCKPGESFKDLCNRCICSEDGKTASCTKKECRKPGQDGFSCTPKENFKDCCNSCVCSEDGKSAMCTLMACMD